MHAVYEREVATSAQHAEARGLGTVAAEFAGQIATAVWLGKLTDDAAREALWSYAMACHGNARPAAARLLVSLTAEYRRRRELQDACC